MMIMRISGWELVRDASSNRSTRNKIGDCLFVHEKVDREQIENTRMCMETYWIGIQELKGYAKSRNTTK